jgi:succinyl-CoA synthetase beta subunit
VAKNLLGKPLKGLIIHKLLIEELKPFLKEHYLSIIVDRAKRQNVIMFSPEGGVDIEELAASRPEAIGKYYIHPERPLTSADVEGFLKQWDMPRKDLLIEIILKLEQAYRENDAELAEINPLVWRGDVYHVIDAKMTIDDNALYRHPELLQFQEESETDDIEKEAHRRKIAYVRLGGNVGIIGNGAGLVMGTMDEVGRAGGKPANFLDIGGGAKAEMMKNSLEVVLMDPNVKGIFINIFGGITRCDEVAKGIIEVTSQQKLTLPIVIRLTGTRAEEGRALLSKSKLVSAESMEEGARKIVELVGK